MFSTGGSFKVLFVFEPCVLASAYSRLATTIGSVSLSVFCLRHSLESFVLASAYSRLATTIGSEGLNCRVRNENGCTPFDETPTQKIRTPA